MSIMMTVVFFLVITGALHDYSHALFARSFRVPSARHAPRPPPSHDAAHRAPRRRLRFEHKLGAVFAAAASGPRRERRAPAALAQVYPDDVILHTTLARLLRPPPPSGLESEGDFGTAAAKRAAAALTSALCGVQAT